MTTAREIAATMGGNVALNYDDLAFEGACRAAADAASDVWEPLLRSLVIENPFFLVEVGWDDFESRCVFCDSMWDTHADNCSWVKTKEMLG